MSRSAVVGVDPVASRGVGISGPSSSTQTTISGTCGKIAEFSEMVVFRLFEGVSGGGVASVRVMRWAGESFSMMCVGVGGCRVSPNESEIQKTVVQPWGGP